MSDALDALPSGYAGLLGDIKQRVRHAQTRAVLAVNAELIRLYWDIGALIASRQKEQGWGAAVIPRLSRDLHNELPEEKGFSERNIKRMLAFYREYPQLDFVPQAVAQNAPATEVPQAVAQNAPAPEAPQAVAQNAAATEAPQAVALFQAELLQAIPWGHHAELMAKAEPSATSPAAYPRLNPTWCNKPSKTPISSIS